MPDCLLFANLQASSQGHCAWGVRQRRQQPPWRQQLQSMQQQPLVWAWPAVLQSAPALRQRGMVVTTAVQQQGTSAGQQWAVCLALLCRPSWQRL
jgi:hypothetical protein